MSGLNINSVANQELNNHYGFRIQFKRVWARQLSGSIGEKHFIFDKRAELGSNYLNNHHDFQMFKSIPDDFQQQLCAFSPVHKTIQINL